MKLVHLIPHLNQEASGPSYSVPRLCQSLAALNNEVAICCLAARGKIDGVAVSIHPQWRFPAKLAISPSLARALPIKAAKVDLIHNHSLWSMINLAAGWLVPGGRAKLVTSPRGTLSSWALGRRSIIKKVLWPLQRRVLDRADAIHVTSEAEYREVRAKGFTAPVAIIPNGIDLPRITSPQSCPSAVRTVLFLSRIHPTKCVEHLLHAWHDLQGKHPHWQLVIAGTGEDGYTQQLKRLSSEYSLQRVTFIGGVYGEDKSRLYSDADLFVLPSYSENFGMVVAEALAHGVPAIVSQGAPWDGLEANNCGWWVEHTAAALTAAMHSAMSVDASQLREMGANGRAWMARDFTWSAIAARMDTTYRWLLTGGPPPEWVRTA